MQILKKSLLSAVILLLSIVADAQVEGVERKAFRESYKYELGKDYDRAISALMNSYSDKYEMNLRLGWLQYNNKNYTASENFYQKAVAQKPDAIEAKMGLVLPLVMLESWDKVLKQYEDMMKVDPLNVTANYWAGVINYNRKKYETAAKYFEKVVKLHPFGYDANNMLGWSYLNLGKQTEAKIYFNQALLISPDDTSAQDGLGKIK